MDFKDVKFRMLIGTRLLVVMKGKTTELSEAETQDLIFWLRQFVKEQS